MPRYEWEDEGDEWNEDFTEEGTDEDEEEPTVPCPYCKREIHEEALRCPYCEEFISQEDSPPTRKPWWIIVGTLLCFYVFYRWIFG